MTDLKEFQRFEQRPFVRERNMFWRRAFARNIGILWDQLQKLLTLKLFTLINFNTNAILLLRFSNSNDEDTQSSYELVCHWHETEKLWIRTLA